MKTCLAITMATTLLTAFAPTLATAQDVPDQNFTFTYGAALVGLSGVYVGQDDELLAFPIIAVSRGQWSLSFAKGIQFQALQTATTSFSLGLTYDPAADMPDTALFAGLESKQGAAFEIEGSHDFGYFDIAATVRRDVSDRHNGVSGDLSLGRSVAVGMTLIEARIGASYLDQHYGNALYGVASSEANALRSTYDLDASWSPFVELSAIVPVTDSTVLIASFRHEELSNDIKNSPLVDVGERTTFGLSFIRTF